MDVIQNLRFQASNNGRLATTPQQIVTSQTQNDQSAIQIQPANPQIIYTPVYNPASVWGPAVSGGYPAPSYDQGGYDNGFGSGINIGSLLSGFLGASGGWGWILNWFTHTLSLNSLFFDAFGSNSFGGGGFNAGRGLASSAVWAHNPAHRLGVPYSNGFLSARYRGAGTTAYSRSSRISASRPAPANFASADRSPGGYRSAFGATRGATPALQPRFASNGSGFSQNSRQNFSQSSRQNFPQSSPQNFRNVARAVPQREAPQHFSSPRASSQHFSSSRSSAPRGSSHASGSKHSGGGGGGHSGKSRRKH
jgi:hypothetical protein